MHHALLRLFQRLWTSAFLSAVVALLAPHAHAAYTINADGTVTDTITHLVWDRCVLGLSSHYFACDSGAAQTFTWAQALAEVQARNAANHLGHRDWRLPNANELLSLVDPNASASAYTTIDATAFPHTPFLGDKWSAGLHWTSTTLASNPVFAWATSFSEGYNGVANKTLYNAFVRLVRGGAFDSLGDTTAPVTTAGPVVSSGPTQNSAIVSVTLNEAGTGYWLLVPGTAATPPTSAQVMAGSSYGSVTVVAADRVTLSANNAGLIYVFGLNPTSTYTLYFAAIGDSFNLHATPSSLTFTTATPVDGACGGAHQSPLPATTAPNSGLCNAGDASSVTESIGAYTWYCAGTNGGADYGTCSTGRGYTVTPSAGAHGSINPSTAQVVAYNHTVSFNLLPDIGYTGSASGCGGSLSGNTYTTGGATADCAVAASFTANTYTITTTASPLAGGSVSCTPGSLVSHGGNTTCTATPNTGYTFSAWSGDCTGTGACSLTNVTSAKAVTAQFTLNTYPITTTASPLAGGSVSCTPSSPVSHGGNATCTATPNTGYTFSAWSGDCTGSGACSLTNVTSAKAVTALFVPVVNGACGSAANTSSAYTPDSANLCASNGGTASAVTAGTSAWGWTCTGSSNGGTHASCSAPFAATQDGSGIVGAIQVNSGNNNWQIDTTNSGFISPPAAGPAGVTLSGVTKVNLVNGTPGSQATVVLHFSSIPAGAQLYKYGKQAATDARNQWFAFPATIDRDAGTVTYALTDGQKGDNDWDATNGVIDDPMALGVVANVSGVPALNEWALALLAALMGTLGLGATLRRRS